MTDRILVVGVSTYARPSEFGPLPGVSNDAREMANLLTSTKGVFEASGMHLLVDQQATLSAVVGALDTTLCNASADDVVLVYLAGHGALDSSDAYFATHDTNGQDLLGTAIRLSALKEQFERTRCRRVILMLDSCHAGGVIARGESVARSAVERAVRIVAGEGRVVMAACTALQYASESLVTGHGYFTDAVLRGLKGDAADKRGEITIGSLFDFVDHDMGRPGQRPMLAGQLTGRMVLAYAEPRAAGAGMGGGAPQSNGPQLGPIRDSAPWLLLGQRFLRCRRATESANNISATCEASTVEDDHFLRTLSQTSRSATYPFAYGDTAGDATIHTLRAETDSVGKRTWEMELTVQSARNSISEMGTQGYTSEELAELRAKRLLTGEPRHSEHRLRANDTVEMLITGLGVKVTGSLFAELFPSIGQHPEFLKKARLVAMYRLQASGCCDDTILLELEQTGETELAVRFEGHRRSGFTSSGGPIRVDGRVRLED